jgi:ATP-dependent Zn protease
LRPVTAESRPHADRVAKISIIPRGVAALGYTQQQPTEEVGYDMALHVSESTVIVPMLFLHPSRASTLRAQ